MSTRFPALCLLAPLLAAAATGCGSEYKKSLDVTVHNDSSHLVTVDAQEGCYGGKTHTITVAPGESGEVHEHYMCNEHDDRTDRIETQLQDFTPIGYRYHDLDAAAYLRAPYATGDAYTLLEVEPTDDPKVDGQIIRGTLSDAAQLFEIGFDPQPSSPVETREYELKAIGTSPTAALWLGVPASASAHVPPPFGSVQRDGLLFLPMTAVDFSYTGHNVVYSDNVACTDQGCKEAQP